MKSSKPLNPFIQLIVQNYLSFGFLITTISVVGSLYFSEIMKLPPCDLCWYQRAFMYPQAVIFGIALWKNDKDVKRYILSLSVVGFVIGIYHNLLQLNPGVLPCTSNSAVSCATKQIEVFGLDAIPLMSVAGFGVLIILSLLAYKVKK